MGIKTKMYICHYLTKSLTSQTADIEVFKYVLLILKKYLHQQCFRASWQTQPDQMLITSSQAEEMVSYFLNLISFFAIRDLKRAYSIYDWIFKCSINSNR